MDDKTIRNLDSAIAKAPPAPEAFDAYRLGDSALLPPATSRASTRCLVRITAPPDTRAFPIFQTNDNHESDLLLARGTRFRVVSVDPASDGPMRMHLEIIP
jgi:hypothetical protein